MALREAEDTLGPLVFEFFYFDEGFSNGKARVKARATEVRVELKGLIVGML